MDAILQLALFVVIGVLAVGSIVWHYSRSSSVLQKWADENGFEIIHSEYRYLSRGPFFWTTSKGQTVYYVTVRDGSGEERSGWVRCGGWFAGLLTDKAEVRWDN